MPVKFLCYASILFLVMALFVRPDEQFRAGLALFVVCAAAFAIWSIAHREQKAWTAAFIGIMLLANPFVSQLFSTGVVLLIDATVLLAFLSFAFLELKPRATIDSVTSLAPRTPSL